MGTKTIWDGKDLPPIGCEVRIHLASFNKWIRHIVDGYQIFPSGDDSNRLHRIFVHVFPSEDKRSGVNSRLLCDVRPVDFSDDDEED